MLRLPETMSPIERCKAIESAAARAASRPHVQRIASRIRLDALKRYGEHMTREQLAAEVLAVVAAPRYRGKTPPRGGQWCDTAVSRVVADGGDCVDRTHALLALFYALGFAAFCRWFVQPGPLDHVAADVMLDDWTPADALRVPPKLGAPHDSRAIALPRDDTPSV